MKNRSSIKAALCLSFLIIPITSFASGPTGQENEAEARTKCAEVNGSFSVNSSIFTGGPSWQCRWTFGNGRHVRQVMGQP